MITSNGTDGALLQFSVTWMGPHRRSFHRRAPPGVVAHLLEMATHDVLRSGRMAADAVLRALGEAQRPASVGA